MWRPGQSLRASSQVARQFSRPGARCEWPSGHIASLPRKIVLNKTEATHDTTPNRFVKFALRRWQEVITDIEQRLVKQAQTAAVVRGLGEIQPVLEQLETVLRNDLFEGLGSLNRFPADDQVLQRRDGYRDIFRAYMEFELAARLTWRSTEASYAAGQRDVAALYEYWAFIQLAHVTAGLVGQSFDLSSVIDITVDGMNVALQRRQEKVLAGTLERSGRKLQIQLFFNRTFRKSTLGIGSWTRAMRPDYSLVISAADGESAGFEPIALHFDAKYRVKMLAALFGDPEEITEGRDGTDVEGGVSRTGALRDDLLMMHTYKDAIRAFCRSLCVVPGRRSAGRLRAL